MVSPLFRAGHGNDLLDDVYELSILEYLLDVHLGADVLLGMLVVVSRGLHFIDMTRGDAFLYLTESH